MTVQLTNEESLEFFHNALCNGLGYISGYDIGLVIDPIDYKEAKAKLNNPCYENVLIQVLKDGNELDFVDNEGEETHNVTLQMVYDRVKDTPHDHLMDMVNEQDDAITADCILQTVIFGEVIFG